ncbi:response regulator transcription factor [Lachnospiraceae bacterium NSJ-143]|nr:response regulator transcription factor [Lachnospiraceae bacterium NSJ-143]
MAYITIQEDNIDRLEKLKKLLAENGFEAVEAGQGDDSDYIYRFDGLEIDDEKKRVTVDGRSISLTPTEYNILRILMKQKGRVLSAEQIYRAIWHVETIGVEENVIAVHIRRIRMKIEHDPKKPHFVKAVWGVGYRVG